MSLGLFPTEILVDISNYLNLESLVSLAQVNRRLWTIATTLPSYWLPSIHNEPDAILLFDDPHLSLFHRSARELHLAVRDVVHRERSMRQDQVQLRSYTHIKWPFGSPEVPSTTAGVDPGDARWEMNKQLTDFHGEWLYTVSTANQLRIFHLRTGKLAYEGKPMYPQAVSELENVLVQFAIDFVSVSKSVFVLVANDGDPIRDDETPTACKLFISEIDLNPDTSEATVKPVTPIALPGFAHSVDINSPRIFVAINNSETAKATGESSYSLGLHLWDTGTFCNLPKELLPSIALLTFREYTLSIARRKPLGLYFQVLLYPDLPNVRVDDPNMYRVVATIQLPPLATNLVPLLEETAGICHYYRGLTRNVVRVWARENVPSYQGFMWTILEIDLDFDHLLRRWHALGETGEFSPSDDYYTITHRRICEPFGLTHWVTPGLTGRSFFWFRFADASPTDPTQAPTVDEAVAAANSRKWLKRVRLFASDAHDLKPSTSWDMAEDSFGRREAQKYNKKELTTPVVTNAYDDGAARLECVIRMDEREGVFVMTMRNGDIWVLRYGRD